MNNYNRMKKLTREAGRFMAVSMLAAACVALPVHAVPDEPAPVLQPGVPMKYVVKKGDTLWDIAGYFLRDPWLWPEIWFINNEVQNPHLIYPGDILYLVWRDGKPRVERSNVVKLSPEIRSTVIDTPIPTIPLEIIESFLKGPRMVGQEELDRAPYVVGFQEEHLIGGPYDPIYVRFREADQELEEYTVVRPKQDIFDPETGDKIGVEVIQVANVEKVNDAEQVSRFKPTSAYREINKGDPLLPVEELGLENPYFTPRAPDAQIAGEIVSVHNGNTQLGQYYVVTLNRGSQDGLAPGHVLDIRRAAQMIDDPHPVYKRDGVPHGPGGANNNITGGEPIQLPEEVSGQLMVFKTYEKISYGLVMTSIRHVNVGDLIRNPIPSR
ncbi:MAG: LysM peptidoglycan-binding domain-containing protein [Nevskiales bacterium]